MHRVFLRRFFLYNKGGQKDEKNKDRKNDKNRGEHPPGVKRKKMKSLFNAKDRENILGRIDKLNAESRAQWGRLTVNGMLCHLGDQLRVALGDIPVTMQDTFLRRTLLKWLTIYVPMPIPKGKIETSPEMLKTESDSLEDNLTALRTLVHRFADAGPEAEWQAHPAFGKLSGKQWGILAYKHYNFHLEQFGV